MSRHTKKETADASADAYLILWVQTRDEPQGQEAAQILGDLQKEFPELGKFEVIEVNDGSIGEPLPFLATPAGAIHGLGQIKYFASFKRKIHAVRALSVA